MKRLTAILLISVTCVYYGSVSYAFAIWLVDPCRLLVMIGGLVAIVVTIFGVHRRSYAASFVPAAGSHLALFAYDFSGHVRITEPTETALTVAASFACCSAAILCAVSLLTRRD